MVRTFMVFVLFVLIEFSRNKANTSPILNNLFVLPAHFDKEPST